MAKDFVFRIKPGDPLPPIAPSGYRFMLDESTGAIKLLTSDGRVVDPTSDALVPVVNNLQDGDFLIYTDGYGFENVNFTDSVDAVTTKLYGFQEFTYVQQTLIDSPAILDLSGKTISLLKGIERGFYADVDRIVCEIRFRLNPYTISGVIPSNLGLKFTGPASGALGNIDISFLTATEDSFVVQHTNRTGPGGALPTSLDSTAETDLEMGLSQPATIICEGGGGGDMKITVFYKLRQYGAEYK